MKYYRIILYPSVFFILIMIYFYTNGNPFTSYNVDNSIIENIIEEHIEQSMSDYDKIKSIHDYIIVNTVYDTENFKNNSIPDINYTAKGVFEKGIAVCRGYAEAFQMLMDELNIECQIITGYAEDTTHAWNVVKLDGQWYHIDTTFDDPIDESGESIENPYSNLRYDYFLVNDEQILIDHTIDSVSPTCTSDLYMYNEKKYNTPYVIVENISQIPSSFADLYLTGKQTVTFYFSENIDLSASGIINKIGGLLHTYGKQVSGCSYTVTSKCGIYYYTTITVN